jgi:hypothetical protein
MIAILAPVVLHPKPDIDHLTDSQASRTQDISLECADMAWSDPLSVEDGGYPWAKTKWPG